MSPEFSKTGIRGLGSIDFFVAPNKWGLELTCNGNKIEEHSKWKILQIGFSANHILSLTHVVLCEGYTEVGIYI